jgi:hypothetical protein
MIYKVKLVNVSDMLPFSNNLYNLDNLFNDSKDDNEVYLPNQIDENKTKQKEEVK